MHQIAPLTHKYSHTNPSGPNEGHKVMGCVVVLYKSHLTVHNSTVLNDELNWRNTDWASEASEIKSLQMASENNKCK